VVCAYLLPGAPPTFPYLLYSTLLPSLPTPDAPDSQLLGCVTFVRGRLCACSGQERLVDLSRLAEFQTPTIFDRDINLHRSIFYRFPKITKIII
jgi:hypothetical protein